MHSIRLQCSPIFRVHGTRIPNENELWSYEPKAQTIPTDFDVLRYRLMPYILKRRLTRRPEGTKSVP
jgi:alpha-glucosidase (family GH31 glycosyl hydrolase)